MVDWLWREQHRVGTTVCEEDLAIRFGLPLKSLRARMLKVELIGSVLEVGTKSSLWSYYVRRNPRSKASASRDPLRDRVQGGMPEVQAQDP